jgi:hypothetical protein
MMCSNDHTQVASALCVTPCDAVCSLSGFVLADKRWTRVHRGSHADVPSVGCGCGGVHLPSVPRRSPHVPRHCSGRAARRVCSAAHKGGCALQLREICVLSAIILTHASPYWRSSAGGAQGGTEGSLQHGRDRRAFCGVSEFTGKRCQLHPPPPCAVHYTLSSHSFPWLCHCHSWLAFPALPAAVPCCAQYSLTPFFP